MNGIPNFKLKSYQYSSIPFVLADEIRIGRGRHYCIVILSILRLLRFQDYQKLEELKVDFFFHLG